MFFKLIHWYAFAIIFDSTGTSARANFNNDSAGIRIKSIAQ